MAVFILLSLLAGLMYLITLLFKPQPEQSVSPQVSTLARPSAGFTRLDAAHLAAIATVYQKLFPGKRLSYIREITSEKTADPVN